MLVLYNSIANEISSPAFWVSIVLSFLFGVVMNFVFRKITAPRIKIQKTYWLDKTNKPAIWVRNKSRFRAYDLYFTITYIHINNGEDEPFRTGEIKESHLDPDGEGKGVHYNIIPEEQLKYDITKSDCKIRVVLIFHDKAGSYQIVEQECFPDTSISRASVKI